MNYEQKDKINVNLKYYEIKGKQLFKEINLNYIVN